MGDGEIARKSNVKITLYPINARCQSVSVCKNPNGKFGQNSKAGRIKWWECGTELISIFILENERENDKNSVFLL